jgi:hypothetical protein
MSIGSTRLNHIGLLKQTAKTKGLSDEAVAVLERIMHVESSDNIFAANKRSSAKGLFQVIDETWNKYVAKHPDELSLEGRSDSKQQMIFATYFIKDNEKALKEAGIPATTTNLYLTHFLGAGGGNGTKGAIDVIKEAEKSPNTPIKGFLPDKVINANSEVWMTMDGRKGLAFEEFAVGDLANWANGKMKETDQSKYYKTASEPHYKKDKFGVPESMGSLVMVAIAAAVVLAVALVDEISGMFSGGDDGVRPPPNTPRRPSPRGLS